MAPAWGVVKDSKITSKLGIALGLHLARVPGSCWAILGTGKAAGMGVPSGEVPEQRESSAGS